MLCVNKEKKRVRILLRVSSDQQLEADGDLSIQRQLDVEYIKNHADWILDDKEYFEGSNSGYKNSVADRGILQEIYQDAERHEFDILVVYKDDRLGRRMWEIGGYIMALKSQHVDVYSVRDGLISPETTDIMGQIMLSMRYAMAQKSSSDTGVRVKDTAKKLVEQGRFMGGNAPYGYTLEYSGQLSKHGRALKHLVIYPEQAEVVKYIYNLSLNLEYGSTKIANILNHNDRYEKLAPNDVWRSGTITSILTNPIYAGYTAYNRREHLNGRYRSLDSNEWIIAQKQNPDIVIVDEDTWIKVQEKRRQRSSKYKKSSDSQDVTVIKRNDGMLSLTDVLHCGYCGCKMVNGSKYNYWTIKNTGERRTSKTAIYKCQNAWQGVPHDKTKQFRADLIEPIVYEVLAEYISHLQENVNIFEQIIENSNNEKQQKQRDLLTEQNKLDKIRQSICILEDKIPEAITGEYILSLDDLVRNIDRQKVKEQEQLEVVHKKEQELKNASVTMKDWEDIKSKIPTWHELVLNADTATKRVLVNKLVERIDVTRERVVIRFKVNLNDFYTTSND